MSKYKLIKPYPGSHPVGSISKLDYSKFPEFWEKIKEVDYEILSYNGTRTNVVIKNTHPNFKLMENDFKNNKETTVFIHSVKRLSDGEVFTIGDVIEYLSFGKDKLIIDKFKIENNTILILGNNYGKCINGAKKIKTPLFTTEDQIDIFTGDKFYVVDTTFDKYRLHETVGGHFSKVKPTFKRFHSKGKAEEFIINNKPCLSINEIGSNIPSATLERLIFKVKSKL